MNPNEPLGPPQPSETFPQHPPRINWLAFWIVLLAPTLLTIGSVLLGAKAGDAAVGVAVFGGGISGVICGVMLGRRFGQTTATKILLGIVFTAVFVVACIGMSCCGCLASGYNLRFN